MTAAEALREGAARLAEAGIEGAQRDARRLMAHALGIAPDRLSLVLRDPIPEGAQAAFEDAIAARLRRVPVSQIIGRREFYGREFRVTSDVLDPRPETETLVDMALSQGFARVLDLGTGSGCILLTLLAERPAATGLGTDVSEAALSIARDNAARLGLADRVEFRLGDWFAPVTGDFDLIVSNPPYIALSEMPDLAPEVRDHEPRQALTDEGDGLGAYRAILADAPGHLRPGGRILVEIGASQGEAVATLFRAAGLQDTTVHSDMDGRDRVVAGRLPEAK
ncbi:MAG: peptide chain release factor N(5)-glutamine methyltransferase [Rhodobacteraceae bacterium]|nr:peptide chain release factor N(5)-glutamine methyltransferase [Paracoccaceae bacterium]